MNKKRKVLLVEDDGDWLEIYCNHLRDEEYILDTARSVSQALERVEKVSYDAVVTDLKMLGFGEEFGGFNVLQKTREISPGTQVVVITAYGTQELAFRATQQGAYDYVVKPPEADKFRMSVRRAVQASRVKRKLAAISNQSRTDIREKSRQIETLRMGSESIIGNSESMQIVFEQMSKAVDTISPVLIWGEPGTGKRLLAKAIHKNGRGHDRPFSQVSCSHLSKYEEVILKNLKKLRGGTIFLHHLSTTGEEGQAVLNRMVSIAEPLEIRLIASLITKEEEFDTMAARINFQNRLLQRLSKILIHVPPLRYRKEDITALSGHFINVLVGEIEPPPQISISSEATELLTKHNYDTANVRELRNVLQQTVQLLGGDGTILPEHLPTIRDSLQKPKDDALPQADPVKIRYILVQYFNEVELKDLCFDLRVDYESLPGNNKRDKTREIVSFFERHGRLEELFEVCYQLRPKNIW